MKKNLRILILCICENTDELSSCVPYKTFLQTIKTILGRSDIQYDMITRVLSENQYEDAILDVDLVILVPVSSQSLNEHLIRHIDNAVKIANEIAASIIFYTAPSEASGRFNHIKCFGAGISGADSELSVFLDDFINNDRKIELKRNHFKNKKLIIFGAGMVSRQLTNQAFYEKIEYFLDKEPVEGGVLFGKHVYLPSKILEETLDDIFVIINAPFSQYKEISNILKSFGYREKVNYSSMEEFCLKTDNESYITGSWEATEQNAIISLDTYQMIYNARTELMSQFIDPATKSIAEFGCGRCFLKLFLPPNVSYLGIDYVKRNDETLVCDFNKDTLPNIDVDTIFMAGVLAYVNDTDKFIEYISKSCKQFLISYHPLELRTGFGYKQGQFRNISNSFTSPELIILLQKNGFILKRSKRCYTSWSQMIFDFRKIK
ncbi:hypothetical protein FACS1894106_5230 [Spirochaetia bacterium]|nr:hypothetical protein FACS1894106_5230 [Spirochaetia bacterium]